MRISGFTQLTRLLPMMTAHKQQGTTMNKCLPLCAALVATGALAGCGDGTSVSSAQGVAASTPLAQSVDTSSSFASAQASNASPGSLTSRLAADPPPSSDPRSPIAGTAPIDPPSTPTAMSPGVVASVDPTPLVSRPASNTVYTAQNAPDTDVQVQPVVHYAPDSSDGP
jgi:hypothetical protein